MSSKITLFSKAKPFSEEYNKNHRAIHGAATMVFMVMAVLMMVVGVVLDMNQEDFDVTRLFIMGFLFLVMGHVSSARRSQFVENEAIYRAIVGQQEK